MERAPEDAPDASGDDGPGLAPSMIYTSGTTGHPKGAWRPNGVNVENVLQVISIFELTRVRRPPDVRPRLSQRASRSSRRCTSCSARRSWCSRSSRPTTRSTSSSAIASRPPSWRRRCCSDWSTRRTSEPRDISSLRALILGAAPCPYALKVRGGGGASARSCGSSTARPRPASTPCCGPRTSCASRARAGTAVPGQEIRLVDAEGSDVPGRRAGRVHGPQHLAGRVLQPPRRDRQQPARRILLASATSPTATTRATTSSATAGST